MSNKNGRAIAAKETVKNVLEQMLPGTQPLKPTEKEQRKLDALAARWFAANQNLQRQQQILQQAQADEGEQKNRLLGVLEYIAEEHDVDPKKINWAFDGTRVLVAVPK